MPPAASSALRRALLALRPTSAQSALTATLLLTAAAFLSKIISLVRVKYIAYLLGRGPAADAFGAMFQLPDTISYFLIGGATSITFVTMLTRYRERGEEAQAQEALSVIFTTMLLVLGAAVLAAEFLAPAYVRLFFPGFARDPYKFALCVHLTRIILPGQIFFFAGGIFAAVLLARKQFTLQAFAPLIYNIGMIAGGVLFFRYLGVSAIAWGGLAGVILGPFAVNGLGARAVGMRLHFHLDFRNPGLRQWVRTTLPLILGFSLVTVDLWIISFFASRIAGAVALLNYAKQMFSVPQAIGQAAGAASLPFLASLYKPEATRGKGNAGEAENPNRPFARSVNQSVSRLGGISLLLAAFIAPMSGPAVDLFFRGGELHRSDTAQIALYLAIFTLSLPMWSAQALYARAFYATGNTLTPMAASSIIVLLSLPIYALLFHAAAAPGLALASDIGITLQACTFAALLHRRHLVPASGLDTRELGRSALAAALTAAALFTLRAALPGALSRAQEAVLLFGGAGVWIALTASILLLTGSPLPPELAARFRKRPH